MNTEEFIDALRIAVHDSAISDVESSLRKPGGKRPPPRLVAASGWFASLSEEERAILRTVIAQSVHAALFGTLAVLDGVRTVEDREKKGQLVLNFENGSEIVCLNPPCGEMLHDLYQAKVYEEVFGENN